MDIKLAKITADNYDELWINVTMVTSLGYGNIADGTRVFKGGLARMASGERFLLNEAEYKMVKEMLEEDGRSPDIDVPDAFFDAWKDTKGDDDDEKTKA